MLHRTAIKIHIIFFLFCIFFSSVFNATAQINMVGKQAHIDSLFQNKLYAEVLPQLLDSLKKYPKDPNYHYKVGVSLLYSTSNYSKAIEHLEFASTQEVDNLVYYQLGYAYQMNYQFDEAISLYRRFTVNGGHPAVETKQIEQQVSQCENGNFMLRYIYSPNVIDNKRVALSDFVNYAMTKPASGAFIPLPSDLITKDDTRQNHSSYIFYPKNPKPGDKIVYSSYGLTTLYGKDLFIIEMLDDSLWSKPQNLGDVVNSRLDEDFPYLAPDGQTLYFASKGHYSMGGYDIYRSILNPTTGQWSTPENLGFPISSPSDDFFYIPDLNDEMAIFATNRSLVADSVDVVLVKIEDSPIRRSIDSVEKIREIARLTPQIQTPTTVVEQPKSQTDTESKSANSKAASFSAVENDPEYTRSLANGFAQQMLADSLRIKLENLRGRFEYITTAEQRIALEKKVVDVEDRLLKAQRNADQYFVKASQIEQEYLTGKRKPIDKPSSSFTSDHPDYLYQAQFAPTVFQPDELSRLAKLENIYPQVQKLRDEIIAISEKLKEIEGNLSVDSDEYKARYKDYQLNLKEFNSVMTTYIGGKKRLYNDCISVALIKAGANNNLNIKDEIDRANSHFRSAMAIRNNATPDTQHESEYEALLLDELAVTRLEVAFAKLWEMKLFQQQLLSRVYKLEQNIFGHVLSSTKSNISAKTSGNDNELQPVQDQITIVRVKNNTISPQGFTFEADKEPPFQVFEKSPYTDENPIPQHKPLPDGLVYKIQLAAFSRKVSYDTFKGMAPLFAEPVSNGKVTKYYTGLFNKIDDAEYALPQVRALGFKDAFIVAWHDGRSVTLTRAKGLESTGAPSSTGVQPDTTRINIEKDNALYVIQLGSFQGRFPTEMAQTIRALAPGKDIVRKPDNKGGFVYSIGSFTDIDEANRVKDNLVASGIKTAFVVAVDLEN